MFPIALILSSFHLVRAQGSFTLEQVMSFSFPSELVAAARSSSVLWKGVRNFITTCVGSEPRE
jgi:hypothetical protein